MERCGCKSECLVSQDLVLVGGFYFAASDVGESAWQAPLVSEGSLHSKDHTSVSEKVDC